MFAEGGPVGSSLLLGLRKVRAKAHVPFPEDRRVIETTDAEADVREGETRVVRLAEEVQRASASAQASRKQRVRGSVASRSQFLSIDVQGARCSEKFVAWPRRSSFAGSMPKSWEASSSPQPKRIASSSTKRMQTRWPNVHIHLFLCEDQQQGIALHRTLGLDAKR